MPDDKKAPPRFLAIWNQKFFIASNIMLIHKRPEFAAEKKLIDEAYALEDKYLKEGIISGLACFVLLRTGPRLISKYLGRRVEATTSVGIPNPFQQKASGPGYKFEAVEKPGLLRRGARLLFDAFVSLSIGAATFAFNGKTEFYEKLGTVPLVEGYSVVSEELCPAFLKEFQKYDRQIWNSKHHSLTGGDERERGGSKSMVQGFVANCKRRQIYEKKIRAEQGLGVDVPVIIPTPGVPRDISVTLDDLLSTKESAGDGDANAADNGDEFFDMNFDSGDEGDFKD